MLSEGIVQGYHQNVELGNMWEGVPVGMIFILFSFRHG